MKKIVQLFKVLLLPLALLTIKIEAASQTSTNPIPYAGAKPSVVPDFGDVYLNTSSDYKYFTLFGSNLTDNLTVGPLAGYSFSVAPDGIYTSTITVSPSNGSIKQYVYLKFSPDAIKNYNGNFPVSGGGAMSFNVSVSGKGIVQNAPVSSALTILSIALLSEDATGFHSLDAVKVVFDDKFSSGVGDEDSYKFSNPGENLAINRNNTLLSIEGRPFVDEHDTLPLQIWKLQSSKYYIKISGSDFSSLVTASLRDSYLNTQTPVSLSSSTIIPFTSDPSSFAPNRFSIVLEKGGVLPVTLSNIKAYQKETGIEVDWKAEGELNIDSYVVEKSIDGQLFEGVKRILLKVDGAVSQVYTWLDANANSGSNFYRIKVIEKSGAIKYSQVIKVNGNKSNSSIGIFPNPLEGNVIGVQLTNLEKGTYNIGLYSNLGQKVYSGTIDHNGGSATYNTSIVKPIPRGLYSLLIYNSKTRINKVVIVE